MLRGAPIAIANLDGLVYRKQQETTLKIVLNNEEIEHDVERFSTLGDLLQDLRQTRFGEKEFISAIAVNGEDVAEEKREGLENQPLGEITSLEINTDNPLDISLRVLTNMDEFLEHLAILINRCADKFRLEDETEANKHFVSCVEGLQTFVSVLDKVRSLNALDFNEVIFEGTPIAGSQEELLNIFNTLHDTQRNKDWVTVADLLEYELAPLILEWKEILPVISAELKEREG
jgi:hypothetical protein